MAKLDNIIEGLQIAKKYLGGDDYATAAEHDEFFIYPIKDISPEDRARMLALDWCEDRDGGWKIFT